MKRAGAGLLAAGASSAAWGHSLHAGSNPGVSAESRQARKPELFKIGMAGFTFRSFDIDQTLQMLDRLDVRYLCIKDFHLPLNSTEADIRAFHAKLAARQVTGYGVGPIYMNSEKEVDDAFDYARRVGVKVMVGIPPQELFAYVSRKVGQYGIRYAIHNHGPEDKFPDATSIYEKVKDLDPRMGLCLDVGHNMRAGKDPSVDLKRYRDRIFDIHIKNVTGATGEGDTCEMGRGVIHIPTLVKTLRSVKYDGVCSLEFEKDGKDPLAGVAESIGYLRGVIDALS